MPKLLTMLVLYPQLETEGDCCLANYSSSISQLDERAFHYGLAEPAHERDPLIEMKSRGFVHF
jgi:hypothetical protein